MILERALEVYNKEKDLLSPEAKEAADLFQSALDSNDLPLELQIEVLKYIANFLRWVIIEIMKGR